jgi:glucose-6-phosphate isomerase
MRSILFESGMASNVVKDHEMDQIIGHLHTVEKMLDEKSGPGNEFLGWVDWPGHIEQEEMERISRTASRLRAQVETIVVIGIGGSYLGTRAAVELLRPPFTSAGIGNPEIIYAGHHLDSDYLAGLLQYLQNREVAVNVISKSGTTTEPAIAFRLIKALMEEKYGKKGACERIIVTTDAAKGAMKSLADKENYETFVIPDDIGGRYSVLTPVGLLPIAAAGIDIFEMLNGARDAQMMYREKQITENPCYRYAATRNLLYQKGKTTEILVSYDPSFQYFSEWWKQLFGESEGKDNKGIFPASMLLTTDLHSMGQYVQDGLRVLFETVVKIETPNREVIVPDTGSNEDGLAYLAGKPVSMINQKAMEGTNMAHTDGGVPVLTLTIPEKSAYWTGHLFYFFEKACAVSGYLLGVNPFDQPGVEAYKSNMFALLGKPGSEKLKGELEKRWRE